MFLLKNLEYTLKHAQRPCLILEAASPAFNIVYANGLFMRLFNLDAAHFLHHSFLEIFDDHTALALTFCPATCKALFHHVLQTKSFGQISIKQGRLQGCGLEVQPAYNDDYEIAYLILSISEAATITNEQVSPLFVDYPDAILILDLEGNIVSFNKVLAQLAEAEEEELLKLDFIPFIEPEELGKVLAYAKKAINGEVQNFETVIVTAKGNRRIINVTFLPIMEHQQVSSIYLVIKNITPLKEAEVKLEIYHQQIAGILESITDGFFAVNEDWEITYWNKEAEKIMGRPRHELIGNNLWEMFPEAVSLKFYDCYQQAMKERVSLSFEEYFYVNNIWLDVTVYPAAEGLTIYFKDVTPQRINYLLLNEAKENYQQLFDMNPLPILVYEVDQYRILDVNQAIMESYGYSREEFLGMSLRQLKAPEDVAHFEYVMQHQVKPGYPHHILGRHRKKSGQLIDVEVKGNSINFNGMNARIALILDVTEKLALEDQRRLDEQRLRDSVERYQILSEATSDAIFDYMVKADVLLWGGGFKPLFGYEPGQTYGFLDWYCLIHPDDVESVNQKRSACIENKEVRAQYEYRLLCADGSYKFVLTKEFLVYNEDGELLRNIGSIQDITDRVTYIKALETTNRRLKDISWMQSHVVRAPLARLMGLSELLLHDEGDAEKRELLIKLIDSATELDQVVRQIIKKTEII